MLSAYARLARSLARGDISGEAPLADELWRNNPTGASEASRSQAEAHPRAPLESRRQHARSGDMRVRAHPGRYPRTTARRTRDIMFAASRQATGPSGEYPLSCIPGQRRDIGPSRRTSDGATYSRARRGARREPSGGNVRPLVVNIVGAARLAPRPIRLDLTGGRPPPNRARLDTRGRGNTH